jgi:hypothetical protein
MSQNFEENEELYEEETVVGVDLDEISKRYEERSFFVRIRDMVRGLSKPRDSREYKEARIEMQRLSAPIIAIVVPVVFVIVLIVMTAISGQKKEVIKVEIAKVEDDVAELKVEEDPPPDDPEITPMEDIEITVDTPNPAPPSDMPPMPAPPSTQVSVKPAEVDSVSFVKSPVKMKSMVGSRNPGTIGAYTRGGAGYGDPRTEATVLKILWWLKDQQKYDGTWGNGNASLQGFAILTYLAHGEYPGSGSPYQRDFGPVVMKAVTWIMENVYTDADGVCRIKNSDVNEYAFLIAAYAMSEAYGMTKNPNIKDTALKMLDRIVKGQGPTGGWDYKLKNTSDRDDVSFAGWAIQALKAGKMAGLKPVGLDVAIKKAIRCLQTRNFDKGTFRYTATHNAHPGLAGVGCLAMQLLGYGSNSEVTTSLNYMRNWVPTFDGRSLPHEGQPHKGNVCPQYYCYYATQCKYQAGMKKGATRENEEAWYKWNAEMKKLYPTSIVDLPKKVKDWSGKEHKQGYIKNSDRWKAPGEYMDSCLVALQLMVYYRYLPTTQASAGSSEDDDESSNASGTAVDKGSDVPVNVVF